MNTDRIRKILKVHADKTKQVFQIFNKILFLNI